MLPEHMHEGLEAFLRVRKKADGGYGATPKLPATVQDTYHALSIITTLGWQQNPELTDGALRDYLARSSGIERQNAKITFQMLAACRLAGAAVDETHARAYADRRLVETDDLEERYYCCRIEREILRDSGERFLALAGTSADWKFRAASELWMLLYLAAGAKDRDKELAAWLRRCQGFDGGFGFLPGTTSFIENCHDCLRALALLDAAPPDPAACRDYVLACRTTRGGFARKNRAVAFLSSTWHAVASLALLQRFSPVGP